MFKNWRLGLIVWCINTAKKSFLMADVAHNGEVKS